MKTTLSLFLTATVLSALGACGELPPMTDRETFAYKFRAEDTEACAKITDQHLSQRDIIIKFSGGAKLTLYFDQPAVMAWDYYTKNGDIIIETLSNETYNLPNCVIKFQNGIVTEVTE